MDGGFRRERCLRITSVDARGSRPTSAGPCARVVPSRAGGAASLSSTALLALSHRGRRRAAAAGRAVHGRAGVIRLFRGGDCSVVRVRSGETNRPSGCRMTPLRSWLFIPADSERKLAKAEGTGADALILDLEDAVSAANKALARSQAAQFLHGRQRPKRRSQIWVRINPLESRLALTDLVAIVAAEPDGVMVPKCNGADELRRVSYFLDALEAQHGVAAGTIKLLPVVTETPLAVFRLGQ